MGKTHSEMKRPPNLVVGVGGISRSGKSTLARELSKHYQCPTIANDTYFIGPLEEKDTAILPEPFFHWESAICCCLPEFYGEMKKLVYQQNDSGLVVCEGHLLYHRPDVVNLLDVKILITMPKDAAHTRLQALRPRLIPNEKWYNKIMWDQWVSQNKLFDGSLPRSHTISGELDPKKRLQEAINIIDSYRLQFKENSLAFPQHVPPIIPSEVKKGDKCGLCQMKVKQSDESERRSIMLSCGDCFDSQCFNEYWKKYAKTAISEKKKGKPVSPLKCPVCSKDIHEYYIEEMGFLHNYKKLLLSDDTCYVCESCGALHWGGKEYKITQYTCNSCLMANSVIYS